MSEARAGQVRSGLTLTCRLSFTFCSPASRVSWLCRVYPCPVITLTRHDPVRTMPETHGSFCPRRVPMRRGGVSVPRLCPFFSQEGWGGPLFSFSCYF